MYMYASVADLGFGFQILSRTARHAHFWSTTPILINYDLSHVTREERPWSSEFNFSISA